MPPDFLQQLPQLLGSLGGLRGQGNAFAERWAELQAMEDQRQQQAQQQQTRDADLQLRQSADTRAQSAEQRAVETGQRASQDQALQAVTSLRSLLGDESIDTPEALDQRFAFAQGLAPRLGVDPGFLNTLKPAPTVLEQRRAKKRLAEIGKGYSPQQLQELEASGFFELDGEKLTLPQLRARAGGGATDQSGRPLPVIPRAKPATDDAPLDRRYLSAAIEEFKQRTGRDPNPTEVKSLIEQAKKAVGQADDRPPQGADPEIALLRKDLLRMQVERAGEPKEPNQGQFTASGYAGRMEQAEPIFEAVTPTITSMSLPAFELQTNSWFARPTFQSKEVQSYMQAARNFINAVLRRESGAVISPSEFAEARQQYLPQPGDTDEAKAQKTANRAYVFNTMKRSAGPAYESPVTPPGGGGRRKPKVGDIVRDKGGQRSRVKGFTTEGRAILEPIN